MKRKICVVTGTRAEYGLLRWVMEGIKKSSELSLQVIVTGMHLSPEFGLTYKIIENDGFKIDYKVEMLLSSDTSAGITKSLGLGVIGFADALEQLKPDVLILLGDRFELLAAASSALISRVPIAHLHGGEVTQGVMDESIRHAITKMSHLHFVATEHYRQRVIQLGENPDNVFVVGGLGIDSINRLKLLGRQELEEALGFKFAERNLLITYHPVTLEDNSTGVQMQELLAALEQLTNTTLLFTLPNADTGSRKIIGMINDFVQDHPAASAFVSLGQLRYLSCIKYVDGVVGNSSSGILEVPSFRKATINIGDRQLGRLKAPSVIDCNPNQRAILDAIKLLYSDDFQSRLNDVKNPYGSGNASEKIIEKLCDFPLDDVLKKRFYDIKISA